MMAEFENRNSNRNYPFDSRTIVEDDDGVELATDVFVDAIFYPVNQSSPVRLVEADFSSGKVVVVSDERCSGTISGNRVEIYTEAGKHFGTIVLGAGIDRETASGRKRTFDNLLFSSTCVVPVKMNCVTRVYTSSGVAVDSRIVRMRGVGRLETVAGRELVDGELVDTLKFNVRSRRGGGDMPPSDSRPKLTTLVIVEKSGSVFSATRIGDDSALVRAKALTREDVCYQAHLEDSVSSVYDTCAPSSEGPDPDLSCNPCDLPPPAGDRFEITGCAVSLVASDLLNYRNPVKITTIGGSFSVDSPRISGSVSKDEAEKEASRLIYSQIGVGNGIRIEIPGA